MKRRVMALLLAGLMALSLCACGSKDAGTETDTSGESQVETQDSSTDTESTAE